MAQLLIELQHDMGRLNEKGEQLGQKVEASGTKIDAVHEKFVFLKARPR